MSSEPSSPIEGLPNEIFNTILTHLPVKDALCCVAVNRHFHTLAVRDIYRRLIKTGSLDDYELILECYHPSLKISTPYLSCRYLDTWIADDESGGTRRAMRDESPTMKDLQGMYSSFRPVVTEENRRRRFRMLWPGAAAATANASGSIEVQEELIDEEAVEEVNLDEGELFSQLCTVTNVVKEGKKRGFYPSHVNISENVIRIFRRWLNAMASQNDRRKAWHEVPMNSDSILWADADKNIGLRLHVVAAPSERMPLLSGPDDDPAVCFHVIYEELIVRTSKLLWAVEVANHEQEDTTGRGLIVSSLYTTDELGQGSMQT